MQKSCAKKITSCLTLGLFVALLFPARIHPAKTDVVIKERVLYGKPIRVRMPPQIMIDAIQKEFQAMSPKWKTFWQTFVVEDDESKDEFVIIARSVERNWAFSLLKPDCPKPEDGEELLNSVKAGGTPLRADILIGVKKKRSWFRYVVNVYEPIYPYWKNPCYEWSLPPGTSSDSFYKDNYTMRVYSKNLKQQVYDLMKDMSGWKPPKEVKKIPAMKGTAQELIGGEAEELTDEERALPLDQQQKLIEQRRKAKQKK